MNAAALLAELDAAGIRLGRDGTELVADVLPGVDVDAYQERIAAHKPALTEELLQREIEAAVTVEPAEFDREHYDHLWNHWHAHHPCETTCAEALGPSAQSISIARESIEATRPPAGWDGQVCPGCQWPKFCSVLGPRGPHLPGGPCPAWPAEVVAHVDAGDDPSIAGVLAHLGEFTPQEVEQFRQEVADAADDDPFAAVDRAALARFDRVDGHVREVS
jgi:hypothetical protein